STQSRRLKESQLGSPEEARAADEATRALEAGVKAEEAKLRLIKLEDPRHEITRAERAVDARRAQLRKARYGLEQCTVKAPSKGTVLRINVRVGEALGSNPHEPAL